MPDTRSTPRDSPPNPSPTPDTAPAAAAAAAAAADDDDDNDDDDDDDDDGRPCPMAWWERPLTVFGKPGNAEEKHAHVRVVCISL